jgi:hypothetical protein
MGKGKCHDVLSLEMLPFGSGPPAYIFLEYNFQVYARLCISQKLEEEGRVIGSKRDGGSFGRG